MPILLYTLSRSRRTEVPTTTYLLLCVYTAPGVGTLFGEIGTKQVQPGAYNIYRAILPAMSFSHSSAAVGSAILCFPPCIIPLFVFVCVVPCSWLSSQPTALLLFVFAPGSHTSRLLLEPRGTTVFPTPSSLRSSTGCGGVGGSEYLEIVVAAQPVLPGAGAPPPKRVPNTNRFESRSFDSVWPRPPQV